MGVPSEVDLDRRRRDRPIERNSQRRPVVALPSSGAM
jgi:hypothetical protein